MNTSEGRRKAVETNLKKDKDYYRKLGSKGGKNSVHRPMKDTKYASMLGRISAEKRKNRDALPCKLCGTKFKQLHTHLYFKHSLSVAAHNDMP